MQAEDVTFTGSYSDDFAIPFAICNSETAFLYASELTEQHREQYNRKELNLFCPECGSKLIIAKNQGYYFKHFPNESCLLISGKMQNEYREYLIHQSHESEKHKSLKNGVIPCWIIIHTHTS